MNKAQTTRINGCSVLFKGIPVVHLVFGYLVTEAKYKLREIQYHISFLPFQCLPINMVH